MFPLPLQLALVVVLLCMLPYWLGAFSLLHAVGLIVVGACDFGTQGGRQHRP